MVTKSFKRVLPPPGTDDGSNSVQVQVQSDVVSGKPSPSSRVHQSMNTGPGEDAKVRDDFPSPPQPQEGPMKKTAIPSHALLVSSQEIPKHSIKSDSPLSTGASSTADSKGSVKSTLQAKTTPHPISRTKKVAKRKFKSSAHAKKLPTKRNARAKADLKSPPELGGTTQPHKPSIIENKKGKQKRAYCKKSATLDTNREPVKKRVRKKKEKSPATKNPGAPTKKQKGGKKSPTPLVPEGPPTRKKQKTQVMSIEMVVSAVVDVVASEIRHCAPMLTGNWPKVVIESEESSVGVQSTHMPPGGGSESSRSVQKQPNQDSAQLTRSNSDNAQEGAPPYYAKISDEGTIHAVKNVANPSEPNRKPSTSAYPEDCPEYNTEMYAASRLIDAIKRFVLEVYLPFLLSAKKNMGNNTPSSDRIQSSTLLAIREMLMMNADKLFTMQHLKHSCTSHRERKYVLLVFADAIVRNAAKRFQSNLPDNQFLDNFIKATRSYKTRSNAFQFSMGRTDVRSVLAIHEGPRVGQEESMLAKVGFNYARSYHPLLRSRPPSLKDDSNQGAAEVGKSGTFPAPTACAAFHIEAVPVPDDDTDDTAEILDSLNRALRGN